MLSLLLLIFRWRKHAQKARMGSTSHCFIHYISYLIHGKLRIPKQIWPQVCRKSTFTATFCSGLDDSSGFLAGLPPSNLAAIQGQIKLLLCSKPSDGSESGPLRGPKSPLWTAPAPLISPYWFPCCSLNRPGMYYIPVSGPLHLLFPLLCFSSK